jgi:ribonuclease HII
LLAGIDEAGRGAVLGPLVVACVYVAEKHLETLFDLGICDSKAVGSGACGRTKRQTLAAAIRKTAVSVGFIEVSPKTVDRWASHSALNRLERQCAARLLEAGPMADKITADGKTLFSPLGHDYPHLTALDRADATDLCVAAASIVAKHRRDVVFGEISARYSTDYGCVAGGGYANRATESFLRRYHEKTGCLPPETRLQWRWSVVQELAGIQLKLPY